MTIRENFDCEFSWLFDGGELMRSPIVLPSPKICEWVPCEDSSWDTLCGEAFYIESGKPVENKYKFCPHCGRGIKEVDNTKNWGIKTIINSPIVGNAYDDSDLIIMIDNFVLNPNNSMIDKCRAINKLDEIIGEAKIMGGATPDEVWRYIFEISES